MFGMLFLGGQGLSSLAVIIAAAVLLLDRLPPRWSISVEQYHDLGNLLLTFVMLYAYLSFSQFLIIWSGNLPEEVPYYLHRLQGGWQWVALSLVLFHFAAPFALLLSRNTKRARRTLARVAIFIIVMRQVDLFWLIGPELHPEGLNVHWLDVLAPTAIGAVWVAAFTWQLKAEWTRVAPLPAHAGGR